MEITLSPAAALWLIASQFILLLKITIVTNSDFL